MMKALQKIAERGRPEKYVSGYSQLNNAYMALEKALDINDR